MYIKLLDYIELYLNFLFFIIFKIKKNILYKKAVEIDVDISKIRFGRI